MGGNVSKPPKPPKWTPCSARRGEKHVWVRVIDGGRVCDLCGADARNGHPEQIGREMLPVDTGLDMGAADSNAWGALGLRAMEGES